MTQTQQAKPKRIIPPMFWVTCSDGASKHPHKFGYEPKDVKSYVLRLKESYEKLGKNFDGVLAMLDFAQREIPKK